MNEIIPVTFLPATRGTALARGKTYVGIDFGTSTTVVSMASMGEGDKIDVEALWLRQELVDGAIHSSEMVPSVIAWLGARGRLLVGEGASDLKYTLKRNKNIWYSFKMELGDDLGAKYFESELGDVEPYRIRNPKDAARVFFAYLKHEITAACRAKGLSADIAYAVSIPASFEANQRNDLLYALEENGMKVSGQSLIDEPNAAFISYMVECANIGCPLVVNADYNSKVLVFDFGAGTCDISILEIGMDAKGFFSKNIAISKFTELGGDNIDRYITYHYLMPRFLEANGMEMTRFRTKERERIASALYKIAERLKILINKRIAMMTYDFKIPDIKDSDMKTEIEMEVSVTTNKGELRGNHFYLTNKELTETMAVFLRQGIGKTTRIKGEGEYNSIFTPIESAIRKSRTPKEEIDYVLFIGGSTQSPYIQEALNEYFEDSEILVPMNLQTHVSQGAAIHSLLLNGMDKCMIRPITSEPIIVITKDETPKIIIQAGTQIPCSEVEIDDLVTSREGQAAVELPLCVGDKRKMLFNVKIEAPKKGGFPVNTPIRLTMELTADKMLKVKASCMGVECDVEPLSPFANKELTTEERAALKAERQANIEAERNGGKPSEQTLIDLRRAYERSGNLFKAAETYDLQQELYPKPNVYNYIGVYYANAGAKDKAIEYYEKALDENPNNEYANTNLASQIYQSDPERAKKHLTKALQTDPDHDTAQILMGRLEEAEGKEEAAKARYQKVLDMYKRQWKAGDLPDYAYGWFEEVAEALGDYDLAREIRSSRPKNEAEGYYDKENLSKTKINMK